MLRQNPSLSVDPSLVKQEPLHYHPLQLGQSSLALRLLDYVVTCVD